MTTVDPRPTTSWYDRSADAALTGLTADRDRGLSASAAATRLAEHGPNAIVSEPPPSRWQVALRQLADPMNVMLVVVAVVSLFIGQRSVGIMV
ncbi:MAG TPA: metal-transporting ATPase, partial [Microbacterium sp.]|nr:metal-transporting ATPase [Microbacterium sp.]